MAAAPITRVTTSLIRILFDYAFLQNSLHVFLSCEGYISGLANVGEIL
jgi:hypothetical protein